MYRREVDGRELTFGVSGKLLKNALVMYDRETRSLWSHFTGEALSGPMKGKRLERVASAPSVRYGEWLEEHPGAQVLAVDGQVMGPGGYADYENSDQMGLAPPESVREGARPKEFVLGVAEGNGLAVRLADVEKKGVKTVDFEGRRIAFFASREGRFFGAVEAPPGAELRLVGRNLTNGRETWPALGESSLKAAPVIRSYWFAWQDHYPETLLSEPNG